MFFFCLSNDFWLWNPVLAAGISFSLLNLFQHRKGFRLGNSFQIFILFSLVLGFQLKNFFQLWNIFQLV